MYSHDCIMLSINIYRWNRIDLPEAIQWINGRALSTVVITTLPPVPNRGYSDWTLVLGWVHEIIEDDCIWKAKILMRKIPFFLSSFFPPFFLFFPISFFFRLSSKFPRADKYFVNQRWVSSALNEYLHSLLGASNDQIQRD